jgi:2-phospho-L-lactate guanylyltransferase (CobY/MobA/RfbA family)
MESSSETVVPARNDDRVLVIMAKAPRPGAVKTRLAPSFPLQAVAAFYGCLLGDTLALARSLGGVEIAITCPDSDVNELACLAGHGAHVVTQKGEGLAQALRRYLRTLQWATNAALLPSTATVRTCRVQFLKKRSKPSRRMTWLSGRPTTEATIS